MIMLCQNQSDTGSSQNKQMMQDINERLLDDLYNNTNSLDKRNINKNKTNNNRLHSFLCKCYAMLVNHYLHGKQRSLG